MSEKLEEDILRATESAKVLNNAEFQNAFHYLDLKLFEEFEKCSVDDVESLQEILRMQKTTKRFYKILNDLVVKGRTSRSILIQKEKQKEVKY